MSVPAAEASPAVWRRLAAAALLLLGLTYLLQMVSPLRLNTDAITFLFLGRSAASGQGFLYQGHPTHFPIGYPAMLAGIDLVGCGASWAYIGLNCLFTFLAAAASYLLYRRAFQLSGGLAAGLCSLLLLSFVAVKHVTLPLSDMVFLGLSAAALLACHTAQHTRKFLPLALLLAARSVAVRTAGIALVPAFLWACLPWKQAGEVWERRADLMARARARPGLALLSALGLTLLLAVGGWVISKTAYVREAGEVFSGFGGSAAAGGWLLEHRLLEWGELGVNVPVAKLPAFAGRIFPLAGLLVLGAVLSGCWRRRVQAGVVEVYLASYLGILLVWPYYDARFLLPVVPVALGELAALFRCVSLPWRRFALLWTAGYAALGLAALIYSSRLSLAGARFPDLYGRGEYQPAYAAAFGQRAAPEKINREAYELLRLYEKRASRPFTGVPATPVQAAAPAAR